MKRIALVLLLAVMPAGMVQASGSDAPDWLLAARRAPAPAVESDTPRLWLLEEKMVEVSRSNTKIRMRQAVKVLTEDALSWTLLQAPQRRRQDFRLKGAWILRPDGSVTGYDKRSIVQVDADDSYTFSTEKLNVFHPSATRVGDTLAWEYESSFKPETWFDAWSFGKESPTVVSRYGIQLPPGWKEEHLLRNAPAIDPATDDDGYLVWEMRGQPGLVSEPMSQPDGDRLPVLFISYAPEGPASDKDPVFESWQSVGKWYADIVSPQTVADNTIRKAAADLSAGSTDVLDSIRAVTRFVQGVRYLNVAVGRSTAEPHPAPQILKNRFGDCEDKAVLTITLLDQIGVKAYPIYARTRSIGALRTEFPGPARFNHAIVAITAPAGTGFPSTIDGGPLGRLIVFDPTDAATGLGDLGSWLQGTHAVLAHPEQGGLVTLPVLPPGASGRESDVGVSFLPAGGVGVKATLTYTGQYAADVRRIFETVRGDKRAERVLAGLKANYGQAEISRFEVSGVERPGEPVIVDLDLTMGLPGREVGSITTMATQFIVGTLAPVLNREERKTDLVISEGFHETQRLTIQVPEGWKALDPLPSLESSAPIGRYQVAAHADGGRVEVLRELTVRAATIPPGEYPEARSFFDDVARGDASILAFEKRTD